MKRYMRRLFAYIYKPKNTNTENVIIPETAFEDMPHTWKCPVCSADKNDFQCFLKSFTTSELQYTFKMLTNTEFSQYIDSHINDESSFDFINKFVKEKQYINSKYIKQFNIIRQKLREKIRTAKHKEIYIDALRRLFYGYSIEECDYRHFNEIYNFKFPFLQASSFHANMVRRRRMKQIGGVPDQWLTKSKAAGYDFVDRIGIKRPRVICNAKFSDVPRKEDIVIKPAASRGSRGTYLIFSTNDIFDVYRFQSLHSWSELEFSIYNDLEKGIIGIDHFAVEELVYGELDKKIPARDLKFHTFYGKVGLVVEFLRFPTKHIWCWSAEGEPIETGKYERSNEIGKGVSQNQIETAEYISSQIPAPFMRIDFLNNYDGQLFFTEFCSMPGGGRFNKRTDRYLGDLYLEAEMRLVNDLINGKKFKHILDFNQGQNSKKTTKKL